MCVCVTQHLLLCVYITTCLLLMHSSEAGGSEVNPEHEPFVPRGGFVAEMQVGRCECVRGVLRVCYSRTVVD